jgi:mannose-6-phosphate isomerase
MFDQPIFFAPNRVWRCYLGGVLLDRFVGRAEGKDDYFPEDWLASVTRAINAEHSQGPDEGLARVLRPDGQPGEFLSDLLRGDPEGLLGEAHVARFGPTAALLCKYLDSAVRLPIQCHPDRAMARTLYDSPFGKTESWTILDTRAVNSEPPYLLMGFKPGVDRQAFARAVEGQDIPAMQAMLHKIPAEVGKTYFIPGRLPHAIGPGVFMLEVQEPTDWVVQPERYCAGTRLSDQNMYGPLPSEKALEVFDYAGLTQEQLLAKVRCVPRVTEQSEGGTLLEVIGPELTDAFALWRAEVAGRMAIRLPRAFGVVVVAEGAGRMSWPGGERAIRRGDYFLQPAGLGSIQYEAEAALRLLLALPPI